MATKAKSVQDQQKVLRLRAGVLTHKVKLQTTKDKLRELQAQLRAMRSTKKSGGA